MNLSNVRYKKIINQQLVDKLIDYLRLICKQLTKSGFSKIMVGVEEEVNCLLLVKLLKQALIENVVVIVFDITNPSYSNSAVEFCQKLGLETYILKRGRSYQEEIAAYKLHKPSDIKSFYKRFVSYHLSIQAEHMKAALVDIADKSDRLLGTRPEGFYGHLMPFYSLYKSEIDDLAKFLNIPNQFTNNTAVDLVLFLLTEKQLKPEEISQEYRLDLHWLKKLKSHIDKHSLKTAVSQFLI